MMLNNLDSIEGKVNTDLYNALSKYVQQDRRKARKDSCKEANSRKRTHDDQDPLENHEGEKSHKKQKFAGESSSGTNQVMFESSEYVGQPSSTGKTYWFNKTIDTRLDIKEKEDREIEQDNSTIHFAKRLKKCLNLNKLTLEDLERNRKNRYELLGNRFMSKAEYNHNTDQVILAMSNDMDWIEQDMVKKYLFNEDLEYLESGSKDLKKKKYALSITKRPAVEYKIGQIEEDIGILFRKTISKYEEDVALGIHHWS
nr:hypothetical protein [Tanacetum cinerariifolium]